MSAEVGRMILLHNCLTPALGGKLEEARFLNDCASFDYGLQDVSIRVLKIHCIYCCNNWILPFPYVTVSDSDGQYHDALNCGCIIWKADKRQCGDVEKLATFRQWLCRCGCCFDVPRNQSRPLALGSNRKRDKLLFSPAPIDESRFLGFGECAQPYGT